MCKTIVTMSELIEQCNNHITGEVRQKLEFLENSLTLPEKMIWIMFNNYCISLRDVHVLLVNSNYFAMQSLFSHVPGEVCAMSSKRNFSESELNKNGLLSVYEKCENKNTLLFFYETGPGQYDDYIFIPNVISQTTMLTILGDEDKYVNSRLYPSNHKVFTSFISTTILLLEKLPWIGFTKSFPDCVYFQLFLKSRNYYEVYDIIRYLRHDKIPYGLLWYDNGFIWEEYGDLWEKKNYLL